MDIVYGEFYFLYENKEKNLYRYLFSVVKRMDSNLYCIFMIATVEDQIYNNLKNKIGFDKSEDHLNFVRQFGEPHHLFGSIGIRMSLR